MTVPFPTGTFADPARCAMRPDTGFDSDIGSKFTPKLTKRRRQRTTFEVTLHGLTEAKLTEVLDFLESNRTANDIEYEYNDLIVVGRIIGQSQPRTIVTNFYELDFVMIARTGDIVQKEPDIPPEPEPFRYWDDTRTWDDTETWRGFDTP